VKVLTTEEFAEKTSREVVTAATLVQVENCRK
jgi:hypothetical protein